MAITVAVDANQEKLAGKTLSVQSELTSRLLSTVVDVTFGACDNYTSCGVTVDLSLGGRVDTVIEASIISNDKGLLLEYVAGTTAANGKIKAFGAIKDDPAGVATDAAALTELSNASTIVNSMGIKIRVVGF